MLKKSSTFAGFWLGKYLKSRYIMLRKSSFFVLFALVALMCSCISNKQLIAFRTVTPESAEEINKTMKPQPEPRVKINDALIITVTALDPEAVSPYNLPTVSYESPASSTVPSTQSFQYYTVDELQEIIKRTARVLNITIEEDAAYELAKRSRGTPRIANRLFKRVRDFALVKGNGVINLEITNEALNRLKVDNIGLDNTDHELLLAIINKFNGGPVGVEAIASSIGEEVTTIEDVYEPYLLQMGLLKRTSRGRIATDKAYELLGITK